MDGWLDGWMYIQTNKRTDGRTGADPGFQETVQMYKGDGHFC